MNKDNTIDEMLKRLDKARTQTVGLVAFIEQYEQMTNNQVTGAAETLKEIDENISVAYVLSASKNKL